MPKTLKLIFATLIGVFFSIATLEIDVFDYDNSFFDNYDSYVKVDSKVTQRVLQVEFNKQEAPEIILPSFARCDVLLLTSINSEGSFHPYKRRLFLVKSSLLI